MRDNFETELQKRFRPRSAARLPTHRHMVMHRRGLFSMWTALAAVILLATAVGVVWRSVVLNHFRPMEETSSASRPLTLGRANRALSSGDPESGYANFSRQDRNPQMKPGQTSALKFLAKEELQ
jgi:hypothetical protein